MQLISALKASERTLAWVLSFGFTFAGVFAFFFSESFFGLLGDDYGQFNNHFVKDAGLAFFSSGVLLIYSNLSDRWRFPLTLAGGLFVVVHGVFHIHMIFSGMISSEFGVVKEILVIVLPSLLTAFLIFIRRPKNFN